jgi:hypothetical protein
MVSPLLRTSFSRLHALRPWGPLDRIDEDTIAYWREETQRHPDRPSGSKSSYGFTARRRVASALLATFDV